MTIGMIVGSLSVGFLYGLASLSAIMTLGADWIAARLRGQRWSPFATLGQAVDHGLWALLMFAVLVVGMRYAERLPAAVAGNVVLGLAVLFLSVIRAILYRRAKKDSEAQDLSVSDAVHSLTYVLFSFLLYLGLALVLHRSVWPVLLLPLAFGSLLPDLDSRTSLVGRLLAPLAARLEARTGHGGPWHSPVAAALVALVSAPLLRLLSFEAWLLIPCGFLSHVLLDTARPKGTMLFWPASARRYFISGSLGGRGSTAERRFFLVLAAATVAALIAADLRPPQASPVVVASFEESLNRFFSLRGRYLVFADVDGTWQATNRRVSARYEVLSGVGQSLVMLDRYAGQVFLAGRQAQDQLYLNGLSIVAGSAVRVKPAKYYLRDQLLADSLPVIYQMQAEPGLQHIFVSGTVTLPSDGAGGTSELVAGESLTRLPGIVHKDDREFELQYLTASQLIDLATIRVLEGELVMVATYLLQASGPTVTPLPQLASTPSVRSEPVEEVP